MLVVLANGTYIIREYKEDRRNQNSGWMGPPEVNDSNPLFKTDLTRSGCPRLCPVTILSTVKPVDCSARHQACWRVTC